MSPSRGRVPLSDLAVRRDGGSIIEAVITKGDLSKLSPIEKTAYYNEVCHSVGLNPFTRPFEYITLSNKLVLYARREATDQLRKINGISLEVISREVNDGILTVHVRARDKTGRTDEDYGAVSIAGLRGEALANASLKAVTKGKRRVTLSISGLGFLDESEVEDIPHGDRAAPLDTRAQLDQFAGVPQSVEPPASPDIVDAATGEVFDREQLHAAAREAALRGTESFRAHLKGLSREARYLLRDAVGTRLDEPGPLLLLARQADADAARERLRLADPDPSPSPAEASPAASASPKPADAAPAGDPATHRWSVPRRPVARDWEWFADWLDAKLDDGVPGGALRHDNEYALQLLREADPARYEAIQARLTRARS